MEILSKQQSKALHYLLMAAEGDSALLEIALLEAREASGNEPAEFEAVVRRVLELVRAKRSGALQIR